MLDALRALSMGHAAFLLGGSLIDGGGDFFERELRRGGGIGGREYAAGGSYFDPIGPCSQDFARGLAYLLDPIHHAVGHIWEIQAEETNIGAAGIVAVAVP